MKLLAESSGRRTVLLERTRENLIEFGQIQSYAFRWKMAPTLTADDEGHIQRGMTSVSPSIATYAASGEMAAVLDIVCEDVYLKGRAVAHGGIAGVASLPWARRQGNVGLTLLGACRHMRDAGILVSGLYPFSYAFYRKFGWEVGQRSVCYKIPMAELGAFSKSPGHLERIHLGPEDAPGPGFARLASLYAASAKGQGASFVRSDSWWRNSTLGDLNAGKFAFIYVSPEGNDEGYVIYTLSRDGNEFRAHEMHYTTLRALRGLLGYAHSHDSMVGHFTWDAPWGTDLLAHLDNPRVEASVRTKMMFRVVDVLPTLQHLAADYDGPDLTIEVADDMLEWNRGVFRVSPSSQGAPGQVERVDGAAPADLCLSIQRLSQVVCGYASAHDLASAGLIGASSPAAPSAMDALCTLGPNYTAFMNDGF